VKGYVFETNSPEAAAIIRDTGLPIIFSHLHAIEIPNAIRLQRFRGVISKAQEAAAIRIFLADVDAGRLSRPDYNLAQVFIRAEQLSAKHTGNIGTRSLDVLHVATALECGCTELASFDDRQRKIASLAGLKLIP
jgi:predicted nucleic acid-binding protein